jgi:RNA polymerase sigma-70 factor (ECF subfamily)
MPLPVLPYREDREQENGLIRSALAGRQDAFEDLVRPHLTSLNRFARMRVHTDSDAEDVVQQAVLRALRHIHQFRGEASFKTWLSTIAFNEINHNRRARARAQVHPLYEVRAETLADPASSPEAQVQHSEEIEHLRQAVRRLPEKYRLMIQLRDLSELNIVETARVLSITVAAAKTRHHRARKLLVRSLRGAKRTA